MTANQIAYRRALEEERANKRTEQIKAHEADSKRSEAITKRMSFTWQKEYQEAMAKLEAMKAGAQAVGIFARAGKDSADTYGSIVKGVKDTVGAASIFA